MPLNQILNNKKKLVNFPVNLVNEDYEETAFEFVERFSSHPDVVSIYTFGKVSYPGISDLDFIVVFRDCINKPVTEYFSIDGFKGKQKYILNHNPFFMDEYVFKNFWKIFYVSNLKYLYGEKIEHSLSGRIEKDLYSVFMIIDICNYFYPALFIHMWNSIKVDVRGILLVLNALRFPLEICQKLTGEIQEDWQSYISDISNLRSNWFNEIEKNNAHEMLEKLVGEAIAISNDLIETLDGYMRKNLCFIDNQPALNMKELGRMIINEHSIYYFLQDFNSKTTLKIIEQFFETTGRFIHLKPSSFLFPLLEYSLRDGIVSQHLKKIIKKRSFLKYSIRPGVKEIMIDRVDVLNKHALFYKTNNIAIPMVHSYYGYNPFRGEAKNKIGEILNWLKLRRITCRILYENNKYLRNWGIKLL